MIKKKPFLKWAGNKYQCINHIIDALPKANRLIEPFAGSAAVFLNSNYEDYLLGEGNKDLILLYMYLQKEKLEFIKYCQSFFTVKNNQESIYYDLRTQFNHCGASRKRAALFLYLNRHGYNGLCRYNQQGGYNVPFGRYNKPYFPLAEMIYFAEKSQHTTFVHGDFRKTMAQAQPGDIIYCDPPYAPLDQQTNFTSYNGKSFGEEEQIILSELAMSYAEKGITVLISNHDTDFTRQQYRYGTIKSFSVKRLINCKGNERRPVKELIAIFSKS